MTIDLDQLEALARAATPGPWGRDGQDGGTWLVRGDMDGSYVVLAENIKKWDDAGYIAALAPAAVLELVQRLRAAERRHEGLAAKAAARDGEVV